MFLNPLNLKLTTLLLPLHLPDNPHSKAFGRVQLRRHMCQGRVKGAHGQSEVRRTSEWEKGCLQNIETKSIFGRQKYEVRKKCMWIPTLVTFNFRIWEFNISQLEQRSMMLRPKRMSLDC